MKIAAACVAAVASLLLLCGPALAYRPFDGTDADVAALHEIELEIGPAGYLRAGTGRAIVAPALVANWGFARRLELVLAGRNAIDVDPPAGQSRIHLVDTQLSVKWLMRTGSLQGMPGVSVASEWTVLLPESGDRAVGGEVATIVSQRWTNATLHANGAASLSRRRTAELFAGLIAEGPGAWPVRPVAEAFIDWDRGGTRTLSALAGAIWPIRESLALDAAVRLARATDSVGPASDTFEARLGFTWSFATG